MKIKIQIKSIFGKVLFELEKENNTIKETLLTAIKESANLRGANLESANLYGANLESANLESANLRGANLESANLYGANLESANLYGANLRGANLRGANLYGANLESANLRGANLESANLYGANLRGANLESANLRGAKETNTTYLPIYCKWGVTIKDNVLKIGCKEKTFDEWKDWFENSKEEFSTDRNSEDFRRIKATFLAYEAYYNCLKSN